MRDSENIRAVEALGVQWIGFIFWPNSLRYVAERPAYLPVKARRVGVFVDAPVEKIIQKVEEYAFDLLQLHGHETPQYITTLRSALATLPSQAEGDKSILIIKAFNIASAADFKAVANYEEVADYFLFDTKGRSVGGNGEKFDWTILDAYDGTTPFLLSGGIGPDDAGRIRSVNHPLLAGIDLNSRFELSPGLKDITSLCRFLSSLDPHS